MGLPYIVPHPVKRKKTSVTIERGSATEAAYVKLRDLIVHGRLAPGSWIVESDLAQLLGTSRTPIREALQWLQHEGFLLQGGSRSKSRMIVTPLTLRDAHELYGIVGRIEGLAGLRIQALSPEHRNALLATLKKLNSELHRIARSPNPDPEAFADIDTSFHDAIVETSSGTRLIAIYKAVKPQTDRYWRLYANFLMGDMDASWAEHNTIIAAISKGDGEATEQALQSNWQNGAERLVKAIIKFGERGVLE